MRRDMLVAQKYFHANFAAHCRIILNAKWRNWHVEEQTVMCTL
jgi:hypothetical protein